LTYINGEKTVWIIHHQKGFSNEVSRKIGYTCFMELRGIKILFLLFYLWGTLLYAGKYHPWIEKQITLINKSNDENLTQKELKTLVHEREKQYVEALNAILLDKNLLQNVIKNYGKEIFTLKKLIDINKRHGNQAAVLRDEVQLKSYELLKIQNKMIQKIFRALNSDRIKTFEEKMHKIFADSQVEINTLDDQYERYQEILRHKPKNSLERQVQQNIREFYALKEINFDILRYFSDNIKKVYRLNQYTRFNLIRPALYIDNHVSLYHINAFLKPYGLSSVKIILILLVSFVILFVRKVMLRLIERLLLRSRFIGRYAKEILDDIRSPISWLLVVINLELILYIYHDFSSYEMVSRVFNTLYSLFMTFIIFRTLNSIARVKLENIDTTRKQIKSELFNLTVKIINFIVLIIGFLLTLHFAGVNLTAVLSGLGIGGFAVALAARESLSNFFGTLSILMSEVFSQGDWIEADGKEGHVVEIGLRVTTIRTFDNALIAIPNATLANKEVKNWSRRVIGRRIKMKLAVKYDSRREDLQKAIEEIRQMLRTHPDIATEKTIYHESGRKSAKLVSKEDELGVKRTLLVYLDEFADSSINILVYTFTKSTVWRDWLKVKEDVMYKMMEILERNNLEFAFPTITLDTPDHH
jgi:MscS family membrane protein